MQQVCLITTLEIVAPIIKELALGTHRSSRVQDIQLRSWSPVAHKGQAWWQLGSGIGYEHRQRAVACPEIFPKRWIIGLWFLLRFWLRTQERCVVVFWLCLFQTWSVRHLCAPWTFLKDVILSSTFLVSLPNLLLGPSSPKAAPNLKVNPN